EAIAALEKARQGRFATDPPVEELLLALAHARLGKTTEARELLRAAVAWMERGGELPRAASLLGLARGPLTAPAALAVPLANPQMSGPTAYAMRALRAEVEKALAMWR